MLQKLLIDKLYSNNILDHNEFKQLIEYHDEEDKEYLFKLARKVRESEYGKDVYIRGLIEFTNYCRNDCYYCGIRRSNANACRYRLDKDTILNCTKEGYRLGFRTFVLQGGEDMYFTRDIISDIVYSIKEQHPDCAVTLSVGEREYDDYLAWYKSGADRYLLRHEAASEELYKKLHPENMSYRNRIKCLEALKEIGYQVGCGFMVGAPFQTTKHIAEDLKFIEGFKPDMCGIGPFVPHKDTIFKNEKAGSVEFTCFLLSIIRLIHPPVLLPATTALGTISENGREEGILSGAYVVMPNLSPTDAREKYSLYDNKLSTGLENASNKKELGERFKNIGFEIVTDKGDVKK